MADKDKEALKLAYYKDRDKEQQITIAKLKIKILELWEVIDKMKGSD